MVDFDKEMSSGHDGVHYLEFGAHVLDVCA